MKAENTFLFLQAHLSGFSLSYPTKSSELKIPSAPQLYNLFGSYHIRASFYFILVCGFNLVKRQADLRPGGGVGGSMKKSLYSDFQNSDSTYPVLSNQSGWGKDHICCSYAYNMVLWIFLRPFLKFFYSIQEREAAVQSKNWWFKAWFGHLSALAVATSMSFWSVTCAFPNYCRLNSFSKYYFRFTICQELYRALSL